MNITVLVLLFYLSVIGHEMAHLVSMRNKGVKVREFGIGIQKGPRISYVPKTGKYVGIRFSFYVLTFWLGAFIDADDSLLRLPYRDRALVFCAGPLANIHFGCFLYLLLFTSKYFFSELDQIMKWGFAEWYFDFWTILVSSPYIWGSLSIIFVCWFGRKFISAYLAPVLGIILLVWLFHSLHRTGVVNYFSDVIGPVGFAANLSEMAPDMWSAVEWSAQLSLCLGAINLLPIHPLDGGYLFLPTFEKVSPRFASIYKKAGMMLLVSLMIFLVAKDIVMLLG